MNVLLVKAKSGVIVGYGEDDRAKLRAWKAGTVRRARMSMPRNVEHHRKFMALCQFIAERHELFRRYVHTSLGIEPLLHYLKDETGHYDSFVMPSGEIQKRMKSISFDVMDEGEFIAWTTKAKPLLVQLMDDMNPRVKRRYERELDEWTHWCLN
ncbi:MAG TPA: DUF1367 family protein [Rhodanobacteraceae bacterium]|nr:DUF1367 family protein [Rhodanobacteraceae bacterium]